MASILSSIRTQVARLGSGLSLPISSSSTAAAQFSTTSTLQAEKLSKKDKKNQGLDPRIRHIRYHRDHGALKLVPRPLTFSRLRALRHWTIMRAWRLMAVKQRQARQDQLALLSESMWEACEELRLMDGHGRRIGVDVPSTAALDSSIASAIERENAALTAAAAAAAAGRSSRQELEAKSEALRNTFEQGGGDADAAVLPLDKQIGKLYRKAMSKKGVWKGFPIEAARIQTEFPPSSGWNKEWESV